MATSFHLSLPSLKLIETKIFYVDSIGGSMGRYTQNWLDINLFGNQITFTNAGPFDLSVPNYKFEGNILPSFHFGVILDTDSFNQVYHRLETKDFNLTEKTTFLQDKPGEHLSFFVTDPNEYRVEFKCFKNSNDVFQA
ncbi:bleomycin resistance protein [Lutimonas saemankumensis]|uniref:VOC family protein n=1 Tax=Lutimonas saemankumensis TaxID=483016 RepID=UPI001CD58ECB|nr:bleomycin resistance protein [Lutimonas saemankumensis]MCA0931819.1 bleomycin resistance protein [Lutimonas saemankumensis]